MTSVAGVTTDARVAILTCWPDDVAVGSGTTVAQRTLLGTLLASGVPAVKIQGSEFGSTWRGVARRAFKNLLRPPSLSDFDVILAIDGEGWAHADDQRYVAVTKAVFADVVRFEPRWLGPLTAQAMWERAAARRARWVVAASGYAARRIKVLYDVDPRSVRVIPEPFDVAAWQQSLPTLPRRQHVLAVGHLYARKNYSTLLRAWPAVVSKIPEARLTIVGDGPEMARLREQARDMIAVEFLGHVRRGRLLQLYASATVFCHPSLQENFGLSLIEALASGLNIVCSPTGAVSEHIAGLSGVHVSAHMTPPVLAAALIQALGSPPPDPKRLDRIRAQLSPRAVGELWRALIREVAT